MVKRVALTSALRIDDHFACGMQVASSARMR